MGDIVICIPMDEPCVVLSRRPSTILFDEWVYKIDSRPGVKSAFYGSELAPLPKVTLLPPEPGDEVRLTGPPGVYEDGAGRKVWDKWCAERAIEDEGVVVRISSTTVLVCLPCGGGTLHLWFPIRNVEFL